MKRWMTRAAAALIGLAVSSAVLGQAASAPAGQATGPVPLATFFKPAELQSARLSPSGRYMAALRGGVTDRVGFFIVDLEGKEGSHFVSAGPREDVAWFTWVTDDWLAFSVNDPNYRGRGRVWGGLMSMSRDGKTSRPLIARNWEKRLDDLNRRNVLQPNHHFLSLGAPGSLEVLVAASQYDGDFEYAHSTLHALNVATGQLRSVEGAPRADDWVLDSQGRPRVAMRTTKGQTTVSWLDPKTNAWVDLITAKQLELPWVPQAMKDETRMLVTVADKDGYDELREYDAAQRQLSAKPTVQTPGFSGSIRPIYTRRSNRLLGLSVRVDAQTTVWLDPKMEALQARVDAKWPGRINLLSCGECENATRLLVFSFSDTDPGMTLLFTPGTDQWQLVGRKRPDVDPDRMAHSALERPRARDGGDLPVWVTRPRGVPADKAAPAVVLVHGGPWVRGGDWEWDDERQFLASRGYAVIEPEFRGSTGYGERHFKAGFKQWGLAMQDDVSDALKFAVDKGWVDPKRVCIMGASYGGYAALMGLAKDPDQYRCGVAMAAVTDVRNMFDFFWNDFSQETRGYTLPEMIGDRVKDEARFVATSPVEQAARIKAPVLLVHGDADVRVPIQNGERMRDALQRHGKRVEWVAYPHAAHGFPLLEDKLDYYGRVERFLAKHLN